MSVFSKSYGGCLLHRLCKAHELFGLLIPDVVCRQNDLETRKQCACGKMEAAKRTSRVCDVSRYVLWSNFWWYSHFRNNMLDLGGVPE